MNDAGVDGINRIRNCFREALAEEIREAERTDLIRSEAGSGCDGQSDRLRKQERKAKAASKRYDAARQVYVKAIFSQMSEVTKLYSVRNGKSEIVVRLGGARVDRDG